MTPVQTSPAVAAAVARCEAWSNHDWSTARSMLADDVHVTATTTQPIMPDTQLAGADAYMEGLRQFAGAVLPGSLQVYARMGDERNALVLVGVRAQFGPNGGVPLIGAQLYLFDDNAKIKVEQVVFFVCE